MRQHYQNIYKLLRCRKFVQHLLKLEVNVSMEKTDVVVPLSNTNWTAVVNKLILFAEKYLFHGSAYVQLIFSEPLNEKQRRSIGNMFHQIQTFYSIPDVDSIPDELLAEIMAMDPNTTTDLNAKEDELSESDLRF